MARHKNHLSDKESFIIMAGAYALAFRAEKGKLPEKYDLYLTVSQRLPTWPAIFARLEHENSSIHRAVAIAEKNVERVGIKTFDSAAHVLAANIAFLRNPGLSVAELQQNTVAIVNQSLELIQRFLPDAGQLSVAQVQNIMPPMYLNIMLEQLAGEDIKQIETRMTSTVRLAELVLLHRAGIEHETLKEAGKELMKAYTDAAANEKGLPLNQIMERVRSQLLHELKQPIQPAPAPDAKPS